MHSLCHLYAATFYLYLLAASSGADLPGIAAFNQSLLKDDISLSRRQIAEFNLYDNIAAGIALLASVHPGFNLYEISSIHSPNSLPPIPDPPPPPPILNYPVVQLKFNDAPSHPGNYPSSTSYILTSYTWANTWARDDGSKDGPLSTPDRAYRYWPQKPTFPLSWPAMAYQLTLSQAIDLLPSRFPKVSVTTYSLSVLSGISLLTDILPMDVYYIFSGRREPAVYIGVFFGGVYLNPASHSAIFRSPPTLSVYDHQKPPDPTLPISANIVRGIKLFKQHFPSAELVEISARPGPAVQTMPNRLDAINPMNFRDVRLTFSNAVNPMQFTNRATVGKSPLTIFKASNGQYQWGLWEEEITHLQDEGASFPPLPWNFAFWSMNLERATNCLTTRLGEVQVKGWRLIGRADRGVLGRLPEGFYWEFVIDGGSGKVVYVGLQGKLFVNPQMNGKTGEDDQGVAC